jgi:hypothetical protein
MMLHSPSLAIPLMMSATPRSCKIPLVLLQCRITKNAARALTFRCLLCLTQMLPWPTFLPSSWNWIPAKRRTSHIRRKCWNRLRCSMRLLSVHQNTCSTRSSINSHNVNGRSIIVISLHRQRRLVHMAMNKIEAALASPTRVHSMSFGRVVKRLLNAAFSSPTFEPLIP